MPRRKAEPLEPVPPGPLSMELRAGAPGATKIKWSQNAYSYMVDQQPDKVTIVVSLRPSEPAPEPVSADEATEAPEPADESVEPSE